MKHVLPQTYSLSCMLESHVEVHVTSSLILALSPAEDAVLFFCKMAHVRSVSVALATADAMGFLDLQEGIPWAIQQGREPDQTHLAEMSAAIRTAWLKHAGME